MDKRTWTIVGIIAVVAVITGYLVKKRNDSSSDNTQSQLPAEEAEANYTVPPDIGMSVDNTGGANFPSGESGYTYTTSQANSLPSMGTGS